MDDTKKANIEKKLIELRQSITNLESEIREPWINSSPPEANQLLVVYEWAEKIDNNIQIGYNERASSREPIYKSLSTWLREFASKLESDAETIVRRVREIKGIKNQPDRLF